MTLPGGDGDAPLKSCLDRLSHGVLLCEPDHLDIVFANAQALNWFGATLAGRPLEDAIAALVREDLLAAHAAGKTYQVQGEVSPLRGRRVAYRLTAPPPKPDGDPRLLVEIENISTEKEQEYLLESYSALIERKNREIEKEQERTERLLMNVFPYKVLQEFKEFGTTAPSFFDEVTVMFLDFVEFTRMPVSREPRLLISELNELFSTFDQIIEHHACERIKTIGDAYLAVANMPSPNPDHARDITTSALKILRHLQRRNAQHPIKWRCRIGIHTGSVVGSVVGIRKYIYDVFGDGVNTASRMQSLSEPMKITVSEATWKLIRSTIPCIERGSFDIKGFGPMNLYFVDSDAGPATEGD